jgi:tetratricopeptide (TPR) repeat protein
MAAFQVSTYGRFWVSTEAFAIAFFYVALLPSTRMLTSGAGLVIGDMVIVKPGKSLAQLGERIAYLPSAGLAVAIVPGLEVLARRWGRVAATGLAAVLVIAGGAVTYRRNMDWHSATALFAAEVKAAPDSSDGWRLYVSALTNAARYDEAAAGCDGQLAREGGSAQLFLNCGVTYGMLRRDDDAFRAYRRAADMGLGPIAHANIGRLHLTRGERAEAEREFRASAEAEVDPARRHYRNGDLLVRFYPDRRAEARAEFEAALALQPGYGAAREALQKLGR